MSRLFDYYALLVGRMLVGGFFLWSGILLALNFDETTAQFGTINLEGVDPVWAALGVVTLMVAGGVAIVVNWQMRYFAIALALYMILATLVLHSALPDPGVANYFLKNMAIVGALLYISATSS